MVFPNYPKKYNGEFAEEYATMILESSTLKMGRQRLCGK